MRGEAGPGQVEGREESDVTIDDDVTVGGGLEQGESSPAAEKFGQVAKGGQQRQDYRGKIGQ